MDQLRNANVASLAHLAEEANVVVGIPCLSPEGKKLLCPAGNERVVRWEHRSRKPIRPITGYLRTKSDRLIHAALALRPHRCGADLRHDHRRRLPERLTRIHPMSFLKSLLLALILAISMPMVAMAEEGEKAAEKIEVTALPAVVKDGFAKEVPGGSITSAKKLGGEKVRYQLKYKLEGKEHQITLGEDGAPTRKKKADKADGEAK